MKLTYMRIVSWNRLLTNLRTRRLMDTCRDTILRGMSSCRLALVVSLVSCPRGGLTFLKTRRLL